MKVLDDGIMRDSSDVIAADRLIKMKHEKDVWAVIAECINIWSSKHHKKWDAYIIQLSDVKRTRKNKFAVSHDKITGGDLRYTVDIPMALYTMIRALYSEEELKMNKHFFDTFARKFPVFQVAEKI